MMPIIQNHSFAGARSGLTAWPENYSRGALGRHGNVRYKGERGATRFVPDPDPLRSFRRVLADAAFLLFAGPEERTARNARLERHDDSRRISNLLGSLTSRADDPRLQEEARAKISRELGELAKRVEQTGGDAGTPRGLSGLPHGRESLDHYLKNELSGTDLLALRVTVRMLSRRNGEFRGKVLDGVRPPLLRDPAARLLDEIVEAIDREDARRKLQRSLSSVSSLLSRKPADLEGLERNLFLLSIRLKSSFEEDRTLDAYLSDLSGEELKILSQDIGALNAARDGLIDLIKKRDGPDAPGKAVTDVLSRLGESLDREIGRRADTVCSRLIDVLRDALMRAGADRIQVVRALSDLSWNVRAVEKTQGVPIACSMGGLLMSSPEVRRALGLLRHPDDPSGQLAASSLRRLNDDALNSLRRHDPEPFGLRLNRKAYEEETLSRVGALSGRMVGAVRNLVSGLDQNPVDAASLARWLRDLAELGLRREQQLMEMGWLKNECDELIARDVARAFPGHEPGDVDWKLLNSLEDEFDRINMDLLVQHGETEAGRRIHMTRNQLRCIRSVLDRAGKKGEAGNAGRADGLLSKQEIPGDFHRSIAALYSMNHRHDAGHGWPVFFLPPDEARHMLLSLIEKELPMVLREGAQLASAGGLRKYSLNGEDFDVSERFEIDALRNKPSVSLSVRGVAVNGEGVRFDWPEGLDKDYASQAQNRLMLEALSTLKKADPDALTFLTMLMHQGLTAVFVSGLRTLVERHDLSILESEDGAPVVPRGEGSMHCDIRRARNGGFLVGLNMDVAVKNRFLFLKGDRPLLSEVQMLQEGASLRIYAELSISPASASGERKIGISRPPLYSHSPFRISGRS
ncbi:hypothetical protein ACTPOE_08335 [Castellaniella sp. WN]